MPTPPPLDLGGLSLDKVGDEIDLPLVLGFQLTIGFAVIGGGRGIDDTGLGEPNLLLPSPDESIAVAVDEAVGTLQSLFLLIGVDDHPLGLPVQGVVAEVADAWRILLRISFVSHFRVPFRQIGGNLSMSEGTEPG